MIRKILQFLIKTETMSIRYNTISLTYYLQTYVYRLFYAGACEGQMPQILTMIQIHRLTPTPAVICIVIDIFLYYNLYPKHFL